MAVWAWIALAVMAAGMQSLRTAGQKVLTGSLDSVSVTLTRFLFGMPFAWLYLALLLAHDPAPPPPFNAGFWFAASAAALAQIAGTVLLLHLFSLRNFAVGNAYVRTEALLTGLVGTLFFGEALAWAGWVGIGVSVAGVLLISLARSGLVGRALVTGLWQRATLVGLGAGLCFALSSLFIRNASLSLGDGRALLTAALTLATVVGMQTLLLGGYLMARRPGQLAAVARAWRLGLFIGVTSILGSFGWFTAMTLERAAYVKAVGQVELLFTLALAILYFRERTSPRELAGMALLSLGIVVLLASL
jgi:drug/metabolite transporter (DMT)-like permease